LKTIVFDLDETLIHCNESTSMPHDIIIDIKFPTGEIVQAGINIRPGAIELLQLLKGKYEVMIFTASHSCYANEILDYLDPQGELIQHRMYREHCHISNEGYFVKDLRIIGRNMKDLLLVDNAAYCYAYQLDNGVPILPYFSGKNDYELKALGEYLMKLLG
jgi:CTD small phosphatase-like protein 2